MKPGKEKTGRPREDQGPKKGSKKNSDSDRGTAGKIQNTQHDLVGQKLRSRRAADVLMQIVVSSRVPRCAIQGSAVVASALLGMEHPQSSPGVTNIPKT